ncbi:MAG: retention module-containing protein, partial [Thiotrichales bacterium]|nr:retention module-containing protein [Thiotrichales bacterium]
MAEQIIATVVSVQGTVMVRSAEGAVRALKAGDAIRVGDTILNNANGMVELMSANGEVINLAKAQPTLITEELFASSAPTSTEAAANPQTVDPILQALAQGGDLNKLLDATAAGAGAGGGGGGGTSFVVLDGVEVDTRGISGLDAVHNSATEINTAPDVLHANAVPNFSTGAGADTGRVTEDASNPAL